ncbi:hypothetical protein JST56_03095 [Candidatus Dependentiae bacterium]|nr:hypothetical protein [Candidatus Dependentiae bacterium]
MKNLLGCLFLSSICFLPHVHSASTGDGWFAYGTAQKETSVQAVEQISKEQENMEPSVPGDLSSVLTRALSSDPVGKSSTTDPTVLTKNQVRFTKSAYAPGVNSTTNVLYLGAEKLGTDKTSFALSRAFLGYNSSGAFAPMVQSLAPSKVTINGEKDQDNPLVQKATNVTNLILQNKTTPVLTIEADDGSGTIKPATEVIAVTDAQNGTSLLQNKNPIKDANGDAIDKSIIAIGASTQEMFAVVPAMGQDFDAASPAGDNRGIAVLRRAVDDLTIINNDKAAKIDVNAYDLNDPVKKPLVQFAFFDGAVMADAAAPITNAKLGNTAAMFWDDTLQRLFIGLDAKRNMPSKAGGVLNLAVASLVKDPATAATADALKILPIVENPEKKLFYDANKTEKVVGFYSDATFATDVFLATDIIRSMHTTTGKDYLIIAGRFDENMGAGVKREIYAIPLLGNSVNTDGKNPERVGRLAKKDFSGSPTALGEMPGKADPSVLVGGRDFEEDVNIADLFVSGDSVYLCLAGRDGINPDQAGEVGLFQSTALFNENGTINAWTPFTRVMGSMERVFGAGLDNRTGEYLFVTETNEGDSTKPFFDPTDPNKFADNISSVRLSGWGKTDTANDLGIMLENLFPQSQGGVHQLMTFDEMTPGFNAAHLSVMLAVGLDRVALIQTGKVNGLFVPETKFIAPPVAVGATQNVFPFTGGALSGVGPLCTADFSRTGMADQGWLFVGGYAGVAVLSLANGNGAPLLDNLTAAGYPGTGYSFKKLAPSNGGLFEHVRKVTCLNGFLYVLTEDNLYSVEFAAGKFKDAPGVTPLGEKVVVDAEKALQGAALLDFIVLDGKAEVNTFKALLATTKGLFSVKYDGAAPGGAKYVTQEVKVGGQSLGPVIQMQYLSSTKGAPSAFGNLYVLAADITKNPAETKIYRFAVNAGAVLPIPSNNVTPAGLVVDLGEFRSNFFADGSTILHSRGMHFGDTNYLAAVPTTDFKSSTQLTPQLALTTINTNIGAVVRDSASGALYAPGDWGVRANL